MDFDHDGEFDRIMEEIHPMSIQIDDVEVQIDVPGIKQNVVMNVKNILKAHFENQYKDD